MSAEAMGWAWAQWAGDPIAKLTLVVLGELADEQHSCSPSVEYLASTVEVSVPEIEQALAALAADGFIDRIPVSNQPLDGLNDTYVLNVGGEQS